MGAWKPDQSAGSCVFALSYVSLSDDARIELREILDLCVRRCSPTSPKLTMKPCLSENRDIEAAPAARGSLNF